jgi:alpha-glucosidase
MERMTKTRIAALVLVLFVTGIPSRLFAQNSASSWWKHAVFYEIYPRSFADSNNDGLGDLNGIRSKLDYLKELGVDAIWLTPCYPSPQVDFGYDVSDYENIDPVYGTLSDFDQLQKEGSKRGIHIIMDFVMNHTSDHHQWFIDSRSSRQSAHRDWYVWRDGKAPGEPPNNWISIFGGRAWKFDSKTGQYYYHFFYPEQPDLNWRNPAVEKAMFDVTRWWYGKGVSGFRLDAVNTLFEDPALRDNPLKPGVNAHGDPNMDNIYNNDLPEVHDVLRRLRKVADENGAVLIGETPVGPVDLKRYYGEHDDELQMPMDLMFTSIKLLSADAFRKHIAAIEAAGEWPVYVISNHDLPRSYVRYGDGQHNDAIAKVMAGMYLTLRGTPIMYYGEEIGMEDNDPVRKEDVKDPVGRVGWPKDKGRDGERTPMQWTSAFNAGFSQSKPWLPVPASYKTHNVESESKDANSVLRFYEQVLKLRRSSSALLDGDYIPLNSDDLNVLSYLRRSQDQVILVALNMSASAQDVHFNLAEKGVLGSQLRPLISTKQATSKQSLDHVSLEPFGVYIGEVLK